MKNYIIFLFVFTIVFVSRLPFLNAGYGNEQDGWRVASVARYIGTTGEYKASRLPGFPIIEFACSLVWKYGAWMMNLLTALASAIAVGTLSLIAKHYKCKDFILLALTFAFTPIVFINSTVTMDYLWAMMFVMFSWYSAINGKSFSSGFLLGLAIGCRITTIFMMLPFALLFFNKDQRKSSLLCIIKFWTTIVITSTFVFLPVYFSYGLDFIMKYSRDKLPSFIFIAGFVTNDLWGIVGSLAIASIPVLILMNRRKRIHSSILEKTSNDINWMWVVVLILSIIGFALHPVKGAYLIPAIPFLLLVCARCLVRTQFIIICLLIILSSFIISVDSGNRPWNPKPTKFSLMLDVDGHKIIIDLRGPILNDYAKRIQRMKYIQRVINQADIFRQPSVVIVGRWLPYIIQLTPGALPESEYTDHILHRGNVEFVNLVNRSMLEQIQKRGLSLWYLPTVDEHCRQARGIDLRKEGAHEFVLSCD